MALVAGIPDPVEFHLDLATTPSPPAPNQTTTLEFQVHDPWKDRPSPEIRDGSREAVSCVRRQRGSRLLQSRPSGMRGDGVFTYQVVLPKSGMFRVLGDFYPDGATPQLITETLFVPGTAADRRHSHARLFDEESDAT